LFAEFFVSKLVGATSIECFLVCYSVVKVQARTHDRLIRTDGPRPTDAMPNASSCEDWAVSHNYANLCVTGVSIEGWVWWLVTQCSDGKCTQRMDVDLK